MQADLRKLKRAGSGSDSDSDSGKKRRGPSALEEELARYTKNRGRAVARQQNRKGKRDEEDDILAQMASFSKKVAGNAAGEETVKADEDAGWLSHRLQFQVDESELTRRAEDEYAVSEGRRSGIGCLLHTATCIRNSATDATIRSSTLVRRLERLHSRRQDDMQMIKVVCMSMFVVSAS